MLWFSVVLAVWAGSLLLRALVIRIQRRSTPSPDGLLTQASWLVVLLGCVPMALVVTGWLGWVWVS